MKKNDLRDAVSGINKDYIFDSDDFKAVSSAFRRQRTLRKTAISLALCFAFAGVGAIGITQSGFLKREFHTAEKEVSTTESNTVTSDSATDISAEQQSVTENVVIEEPLTAERAGAPLYYSKMVKNTEIPDLVGYAGTALLDIDAFDESMLKDAVGMIEGEILDIWVNQYEYATVSDKFESDGRLYHKPKTVAYTIKVDRVLSGDFSIGDVVTVEDYYFVCDSIVSIKKGSRYVIPIGEGDGKFYEADEIVSGDVSLKNCYFTLYQFHPQIEKVDGGYIVPGDWETLVTEDCSAIIMDIDDNGSPFSGSLYYVPESAFNDRIGLILQS